MHQKRDEVERALSFQFTEAVMESVISHSRGVVEHVPSERLDLLTEEDLVLILSQRVLLDVMSLGLQIMCWKHVCDRVIVIIRGMLEKHRRWRDAQEASGSGEEE